MYLQQGIVLNALVVPIDNEPITFEEAISGFNARMWIEAMNKKN